MGTNKTPNTIRGFLLPHEISSENIWATESTYTNANTQPAQPKAGGDYDLGLTAAGSHDTTNTIRVQTQRAGHIERAAFVWKEETETDFYGYDAPNIISRWDSIVNGTSFSADNNILCDSLGLSDGTSLILYQKLDATISQKRHIKISKRSAIGSISTSTLYSQISTSTPTLFGGMCILSDGSILAVYMTANATNANLQSSRSADDGATWTTQSTVCLPVDIDLVGSFGAGNTGFDCRITRRNTFDYRRCRTQHDTGVYRFSTPICIDR